MNDSQTKLADVILKFMTECNGQIETDQMNFKFVGKFDSVLEESKRWQEILFTISIMEEMKLVEWLHGEYFLKLKSKGIRAAKIGIAQFIKEEEEREQNKYVSVSDSIVNTGINTGTISNQSSDFDLRDKTIRNTAQTDKAPAAKESTTKSFWLSTTSNIIATIIGGIILYFIVDYIIKWIKT